MSVENVSVDNVSVENMSVENMSVEKTSFEKMSRCPFLYSEWANFIDYIDIPMRSSKYKFRTFQYFHMAFFRMFVVVPHGTGFCIVNESLHITTATSFQMKVKEN